MTTFSDLMAKAQTSTGGEGGFENLADEPDSTR